MAEGGLELTGRVNDRLRALWALGSYGWPDNVCELENRSSEPSPWPRATPSPLTICRPSSLTGEPFLLGRTTPQKWWTASSPAKFVPQRGLGSSDRPGTARGLIATAAAP